MKEKKAKEDRRKEKKACLALRAYASDVTITDIVFG